MKQDSYQLWNPFYQIMLNLFKHFGYNCVTWSTEHAKSKCTLIVMFILVIKLRVEEAESIEEIHTSNFHEMPPLRNVYETTVLTTTALCQQAKLSKVPFKMIF